LAGGIAPLWFFPEWFRGAAALLPFAGFAHTPLSIYIGRLSGADAWAAIGLQVGWTCALAIAGRGLWHLAVRKLVVQGG
ncbi:MAG: ABC-2 family transporter protein, partial [Chloroflexi bacterium]|nr:ABC-2 family transporter protein [Chloroflexota bacterium]